AGLQLAYSFGVKHVVLVDVLAIGGLFVIRAAAGAEAVDVRISPWLLRCTALLALFLALAKRRGDLVLVGARETPGRPVLERFSSSSLWRSPSRSGSASMRTSGGWGASWGASAGSSSPLRPG